MKKSFTFALAAALILCFSGTASALLFSDTHNDTFVWFDAGNSNHNSYTSYTWTFDLDNDVLDWGDINSEDTINSAYLSLYFYDDYDKPEYTDIILDLTTLAVNDWQVDTGWAWGNVTAFVANDHYLDVTLDLVSGDFGVALVNLSGDYTDNPGSPVSAPVPEPATMLLLGTGLIGIAGTSRKKLLKR